MVPWFSTGKERGMSGKSANKVGGYMRWPWLFGFIFEAVLFAVAYGEYRRRLVFC